MENYLLNELQEGRELKIVYLSHNSYWYQLLRYKDHFENCDVKAFGDGLFYLKTDKREIDDCDIIVYYSSNFFDEESYNGLKEFALNISNKNNKRVTIGYSAIEQYQDPRVDLASVYDGKIVECNTLFPHPCTPTTLANLTLAKHDVFKFNNDDIYSDEELFNNFISSSKKEVTPSEINNLKENIDSDISGNDTRRIAGLHELERIEKLNSGEINGETYILRKKSLN